MTQLGSEVAKLRLLYKELLSNLDGTCSLPRRPPSPDEDPSLPPSPPSTSII